MISVRTHNILDYVAAAALILAPWFFNFTQIVEARNLLVGAGIVLTFYSALTRYEFSLIQVIPLRLHMALDMLLGAIVATGPWLFNFRAVLTSGQAAVHVILGLAAIVLAAFTNTERRASQSKLAEKEKLDRAA